MVDLATALKQRPSELMFWVVKGHISVTIIPFCSDWSRIDDLGLLSKENSF